MSLTTDPHDPKLKEGQKNPTGQHSVYLVLSEEERAKGFVRPYRDAYVHVGQKIKRHDGTDPNHRKGNLYGRLIKIGESDYPANDYYTEENGYGGFVLYPKDATSAGRYITKQEVEAIVARKSHFGGCGALTKMPREISETYQRDPGFYSRTFCMGCNTHLPVSEFTWDGTDEEVGS